MSWWRGPSASRRTLTVLALMGAVSLAGAAVAAPAQAETARQKEWHVNAMRLPEAWKYSKGQGITVAVIDVGVDAATPDLRGQVLPGRNFSPNVKTSYTSDDGRHGTVMASLIAGSGEGNGGAGAIGVAPEAKILPVRVANDLNASSQAVNMEKYIPQLSQAIRYAADSKARILNISLAFTNNSPQLRDAVDYALSKGKLIFAGSGNDGAHGNPVEYPAAIPGVVGVGGLDKNGNATSWSEKGPQVALSAVSVDMASDCPNADYCTSEGTSDATALASGSAALVWAKHPGWTADQVLRVLINTAAGPSDGVKRNDYIGYGAVRPRVALEDPGNPGPADVNPLLAAAPGRSAGAGGPSAPPSTAAMASSGGSGSSLPWIVVGAVVVVAVAAGAAVLARRRA